MNLKINELLYDNTDPSLYYAMYDPFEEKFLDWSTVHQTIQYTNEPTVVINPRSTLGTPIAMASKILQCFNANEIYRMVFVPIRGFHDTRGANVDWSRAFSI